MADNFATNPGSGGATFASDDVGGIQYPRVKKAVGPDGVAQDGYTPYKLQSAATTNATSVKASAGEIGYIVAFNTSTATKFLKLYNKASAPTVGTDTPVQVLPIPPNGNGFVLAPSGGITFSTGIALAITGAVADGDTTAVAANDVVLSLGHA
jgi:hypothetical protein